MNAEDDHGRTPAIVAAAANHLSTAELLQRHGADINFGGADRNGKPWLMYMKTAESKQWWLSHMSGAALWHFALHNPATYQWLLGAVLAAAVFVFLELAFMRLINGKSSYVSYVQVSTGDAPEQDERFYKGASLVAVRGMRQTLRWRKFLRMWEVLFHCVLVLGFVTQQFSNYFFIHSVRRVEPHL